MVINFVGKFVKSYIVTFFNYNRVSQFIGESQHWWRIWHEITPLYQIQILWALPDFTRLDCLLLKRQNYAQRSNPCMMGSSSLDIAAAGVTTSVVKWWGRLTLGFAMPLVLVKWLWFQLYRRSMQRRQLQQVQLVWVPIHHYNCSLARANRHLPVNIHNIITITGVISKTVDLHSAIVIYKP